MTERELLNRVKEIVHHHLGTDVQMILFGSRAAGKAVSSSDYDIGLRASQPIDPLTMARIYDAVEELPTLQKVEIVDLTKVTKRFYATAMQNTQAIK
ncbi:MAG: nucleotidyltransferase domain-containing protein [Candidatus Berkelbacteria bacterium]|nr:nucleotidyltransferase domain-containing protein [Candidatus Berkelbacteria bacterium]MCR4307194.1 nucleotidyltransferase domain-containing protein [Candidatus Berkelbacteria bacterium]